MASWMDGPQPDHGDTLRILATIFFCFCFWLASAIFLMFLVAWMMLPTAYH